MTFMRIITINTNGIRAAARKGFFNWLTKQQADVICVQETKAHISQLEDPIFHPEGYHCYYFDAEKKGYSGTAIYSKKQPMNVIKGFDYAEGDNEGRYLEVQFKNIAIVSLYLPSGSSSEKRQAAKFRFMDAFEPHLYQCRDSEREYIFCGDWNIAHKEADLRNWKGNKKNSGFLPEERAWLDKLFGEEKFVDAFRELEQSEHEYTWWSNRGQAWANNVGWRIDYHVTTPGLKGKVKQTTIYKDERFSDHAPLTIDYNFSIK